MKQCKVQSFETARSLTEPESGCTPDVYTSMQKELTEELALDKADYKLRVLALIKANVNQKPELIFSAFSNKDFEQIVKDADKADDRFEWDNILDVPLTRLEGFLTHERINLSPSALGSLEMFLKLKQEAHFGTRK